MRISDWSSDVCSSDLILPADAFAVGLEKPPGDQRDAAGDEDHERPAGPAPPQVQRDDQRRQRRRASAIILQRVEKRIAHDKAPIKANSPAALNAGQAMWRPFVYTALNNPVASQELGKASGRGRGGKYG